VFSPKRQNYGTRVKPQAAVTRRDRNAIMPVRQSVSQSTNDSHYSAELFTNSDRHPIHPVHSVPSRPASVVQRKRSGHSGGAVPPGPADASKSRSTELSTTRYIGRPSVRLSDCGSIHTFADVSVHELRIKRRRFITWSQTFLLSELRRATLEADYFRAAKASLCGGTLALASFSRRLSTKTSYVNAQPLSNAV